MKNRLTELVLLATCSLTAQAGTWDLAVSATGGGSLLLDGREFAAITPGLFYDGWQGASLGGLPPQNPLAPGDPRIGTIRDKSGTVTDTELLVRPDGDAIHAAYRLTPQQVTRLNSLHVSISVPEKFFYGASFEADEARGTFPRALADIHLYNGETKRLKITLADGHWLQWDFDSPVPVLLQDDRQWGPTFAIRIGPQMTPAGEWPAGKTFAAGFRLSADTPISLTLDGPMQITAGEEWIPLPLELDIVEGSALDFSRLVDWHRPAGVLGHVVAREDGHLAFEQKPDQPVRFYGVNLCFTAHYIELQEAEQLAERFLRLGYNAVRFHHYDGPLVKRDDGTSTSLHPDNLKMLDGLFQALKKRGIYVTTDLYVSRRIFASEIWPGATGDLEMSEFKMLVPVNEAAFANWKEFSKNLLTHVNPYTGLRYADDPALAWLCMINEGNEGNFVRGLSERVGKEWQQAWNRWLLKRYGNEATLQAAWQKNDSPGSLAEAMVSLPVGAASGKQEKKDFELFLTETEKNSFSRMKEFLRNEIGTRALLTNLNGWTNTTYTQLAREDYDYVDDHFYIDHPQFLDKSWRLPSRCPNTSPVAGGALGGAHTAFTRIIGKPFTISEFNYSGPGRYRGVGGILTGCLGALQDWSIVWRFAYSHSKGNLFTPSPAGYFDLAGDPLNQAAERASICLFRRGDLEPAPQTAAIVIDAGAVETETAEVYSLAPGWRRLTHLLQVGTQLQRQTQVQNAITLALTPATGGALTESRTIDPYAGDAGEQISAAMTRLGWLSEDNLRNMENGCVCTPSGQFSVDAPNDRLTLNTARTAGGYARAGNHIACDTVDIDIVETDATVWISSLDGKPIAESNHLLVTHLTDLQNTGVRFAEQARKTLLAWGGLPHLVRNGKATVAIRTGGTHAEVHALTTGGRRVASVDARLDGGKILFPLEIGAPEGARILYEIVVQ